MHADAESQLISAIVPVFNGERFIRDALDSILAQDYEPLEIIVVNDGSTDGTRRILDSYPSLRIISQANRGAAEARNTGFKASRGVLIAFLDSDDIWPPGRLRLQVDYLRGHPDAGFVCGRARYQSEPGIEAPAEPFDSACTLLAHRAVFDRVGLFASGPQAGPKLEWMQRAASLGIKGGRLDELVYIKRLHQGNRAEAAGGRRARILEIVQSSMRYRRRG
jgi:glycosyltransferase involved in cell wall biosynthesis